MPVNDTIASGAFWAPVSTRATLTSTKWNNHFELFRGHLLPIDGSVSAAANNAYDLGSTTYKWRTLYSTDANVSGKLVQTIASTTGAFSFGSQHMVLCNANGAAFTVTLPAAASFNGVTIALKKTDSTFNLITVDGNGSETIDATTVSYLATQNECLFLTSDGSNWQIKNRYIDGRTYSWTPTATWSTNVSFAGKWFRDGPNFNGEIIVSIAGGVTNASLAFDMPSGLNIDSTRAAWTSTGNSPFGVVGFNDVGSATYKGWVIANSTTTVAAIVINVGSTYGFFNTVSNTVPYTFANTDVIIARFKVPIEKWSQ